MKVMIIGAAGFLGSTAAAYLIQNTGCSVVSVDDLSGTPDVFNLEPVMKSKYRHTFYIADVFCATIMNKIMGVENPDVVFIAGESIGEGAIDFFQSALLCGRHQPQKIIVVRSAYGRYEQGKENSVGNVDIINVCKIFGPRQHPQHFVPKSIFRLLNGVDLLGLDDKNIYEWLYIRDFLTAFNLILNKEEVGVYNVSSGFCATEKDVAAQLAKSMERETDFGETNGMLLSNIMDTALITEMGWKPKYPLAEALEHTANWYNSNPWIYRGQKW